MLFCIVAPEPQRFYVGLQQCFLAFVLLGEQAFDLVRIDVEQRRQRADIDYVLE